MSETSSRRLQLRSSNATNVAETIVGGAKRPQTHQSTRQEPSEGQLFTSMLTASLAFIVFNRTNGGRGYFISMESHASWLESPSEAKVHAPVTLGGRNTRNQHLHAMPSHKSRTKGQNNVDNMPKDLSGRELSRNGDQCLRDGPLLTTCRHLKNRISNVQPSSFQGARTNGT